MNAQTMSLGDRLSLGERRYGLLRERNRMHGSQDPFVESKKSEYRPMSVTTEIVDTDWDEDEMTSEVEYDEVNSPRVSLNSTSQRSATTMSSYDEAPTPRSSQTRESYSFDLDSSRPVEGPRGPHLFRSSTTSSNSFEYPETLSLSPITPKPTISYDSDVQQLYLPDSLTYSQSSPSQFTHEKLNPTDLPRWSPQKVAQWMFNAGIERPVAEKFIDNDINGAILITLKFEDLKELHIKSFGARQKIWGEIHELRDQKEMSPRPETPIEDEESKEVRKERRRVEKEKDQKVQPSQSLRRRGTGRQMLQHDDIISPMESVSIVGIEQVIPKPHHCSKGEDCSKYKKQKRIIEQFKRDHPFVDMENGGTFLLAGDPGNPETAPALNRPAPMEEPLRPISDAVPSVVASSDVFAPGMAPFQYLQEAALRNLQTQDPQDNVRQFLDFQHQHKGNTGEIPLTPPFEVHPGRAPHEGLSALPRLFIPGQHQAIQRPLQLSKPSNHQEPTPCSPSPDHLAVRAAPYRFGTPFSDMDVPVTNVQLGPVARDASQSVPPDMGYRTAMSHSRASNRPSLQIMAPVREDSSTPTSVFSQNTVTTPRRRPSLSPKSTSPTKLVSGPKILSRTHNLQAPPRGVYPWSQHQQASDMNNSATSRDAEGITYQGPVKKRKTRMLRHEWHEQYAILKGTRLALHKDAENRDRTLEYIDIDDYAIACSSLSTTSKLNAAFKAMNIGHRKSHSASSDDIAAFSFQLIPQEPENGKRSVTSRLRKRESQSISGPVPGDGSLNGTGKTHHFAVRSRDERIDWMRELMLAKALKQKGEGFEVSVNGNMI